MELLAVCCSSSYYFHNPFITSVSKAKPLLLYIRSIVASRFTYPTSDVLVFTILHCWGFDPN